MTEAAVDKVSKKKRRHERRYSSGSGSEKQVERKQRRRKTRSSKKSDKHSEKSKSRSPRAHRKRKDSDNDESNSQLQIYKSPPTPVLSPKNLMRKSIPFPDLPYAQPTVVATLNSNDTATILPKRSRRKYGRETYSATVSGVPDTIHRHFNAVNTRSYNNLQDASSEMLTDFENRNDYEIEQHVNANNVVAVVHVNRSFAFLIPNRPRFLSAFLDKAHDKRVVVVEKACNCRIDPIRTPDVLSGSFQMMYVTFNDGGNESGCLKMLHALVKRIAGKLHCFMIPYDIVYRPVGDIVYLGHSDDAVVVV